MKRKARIVIFTLIITLAFSLSIIPNNILNSNLDAPVEKAYAGTTLSQPTIKVAAPIDSKVVIVAWNKIKGAKSYEVYRATSKDGKYSKIKTTTNLSYKNTGLTKDKTYYYKVRAINGSNKSKYSGIQSVKAEPGKKVSIATIPEYNGQPYVILNDNIPYFTDQQKKLVSFEYYASLDSQGRCGTTFALVNEKLMPEGERGSISGVKPTGWQTIRYDNIISDKYLYNRCHLIGWQLTGENANTKNLVTGTRYLNIEGMLPFENEVANYVKAGGKVLYRSTPIFEGKELVCRGIQMEGYSVDDEGQSICFNVFCYNVQPGITINYKDGSSFADNGDIPQTAEQNGEIAKTSEAKPDGKYFVLNTNSKKFHKPECASVGKMSESNKEYSELSAKEIIALGYDPCKNCKPAGDIEVKETKSKSSSNSSSTFIINTNTGKFHYPDCASVKRMSEKNKKTTHESAKSLKSKGYSPCGNCNPR